MPIKNTERKIKNQTNIHGHETPEELLKKREIKIRMINNEISNWIIEALKSTPEECKKKVGHIKWLQNTTNNQITNIFEEYSKKAINEIRNKTKNKIRDNLEKHIQQSLEYCKNDIHIIIHTENNINEYKKDSSIWEKTNLEMIIKELAKRINTNKKNIIEIISLLEDDSFSQETIKILKWYEVYIKRYLQ